MKTLALIILAASSALAISSTSYAQSPAPVLADSWGFSYLDTSSKYEATGEVRLLGRGMRDRKTGEALTLACVGENHSCSDLQWFYTKENKNYFIGQAMRVCDSVEACANQLSKEDKKELKAALKTLAKKARSDSSSDLLTMGILGGSLGSTALIASINPAAGVIALGVHAFIFFNYKHLGNIGNGFTAQDYTLNQNGMNWSANAKKVGHRYFEAYYEIIVRDAAMKKSSL